MDFSVSEPDVDWLHIVKSRSLAYHSLNIEYDANPFYDSRVGKIVVTNLKNNKCDTITVTQAQKDAIVLAENNYKIDCKGGQIQIKVDHNVEFNVSIDVSWITQTTSRSLETSTLVFNIAENPDFKDREGTIQFISKDGSVTQTVKVHQLKNSSFDPSIDGWEDDSEHGGTAE